jgi:dTDP-4-dehydrorhamnose 3,5-epimerase
MMDFEATELPEVVAIHPKVYGDARGFFCETWREDAFAAAGIEARFVQDNHSHSVRHTLRGLHYQVRHAQGKLVRVVRGAVFDVAVDMRRSSRRFGQWVGITLSDENHTMLWVPPGFAHGYLALTDEIDLLYKCTDYYSPKDERAVRWNDTQLGVHWPLPPNAAPVLSPRDAAAPLFIDAEYFD